MGVVVTTSGSGAGGGVSVGVAVSVGVKVAVAVSVGDAVEVAVKVAVAVGVPVGIGVGVGMGKVHAARLMPAIATNTITRCGCRSSRRRLHGIRTSSPKGASPAGSGWTGPDGRLRPATGRSPG